MSNRTRRPAVGDTVVFRTADGVQTVPVESVGRLYFTAGGIEWHNEFWIPKQIGVGSAYPSQAAFELGERITKRMRAKLNQLYASGDSNA